MKPTVSVVIANFNRAKLIGETLDNLLRQSLPPNEVLVVDDGSTDESIEVIEKFGGRVKLLRQSNSGPAVARNLGLEHATGEFIQFFDSDDLCSLNKLEAQVAALAASGADFAYGPWLKARLGNRQASYSEFALQQGPLPESASALSWFLRGWAIVFQACMFRRSLLDRVGRYRPDLMPTEDSEFLFRMLQAGARGVHVPQAIVLYRVHTSGQITAGGMDAARRRRDWLRYTELVARQLDADGDRVRRVDALHWGAIVWAARREVDDNDGDFLIMDGNSYRQWEKAVFALLNHRKRISGGLRARMTGSRLPSAYRAAPLTEIQKKRIRELGYDPVPVEPISRWLKS